MIGPVTGVQVNAKGRGDRLRVAVGIEIAMRGRVGQPRHRSMIDQGDTEVGWLIQVRREVPIAQARPGQGPGQNGPGVGWFGVVFIGHVVPIVALDLICRVGRKDQADDRVVVSAGQVVISKT